MVTKNKHREDLVSLVKPIIEFKPRGLSRPKMGRCTAMSISFAKLCNNKYGMNVEALRFSEESDARHVVNVYKNLVIDWTIRQCEGYENAPYPFVYRLGKDMVFGGSIHRNRDDELEIRGIE